MTSENLSYGECYFQNIKKADEYDDTNNFGNDVYEFLHKIIQRLHLYESIKMKVIDMYHDLSNEFSFRSCTQNELIAFCVYMVLRLENVPRSLKEIVAVSDISEKRLWKLEKNYSKIEKCLESPKILAPEHILHTYFLYLEMQYSDLKKMLQMLKSIDVPISYNPTTIAGGIFYLHSKNIGKKCTLKNIASLIHTTPMSIYRFVKFYNQLKKCT